MWTTGSVIFLSFLSHSFSSQAYHMAIVFARGSGLISSGKPKILFSIWFVLVHVQEYKQQ